jgi:hypothetical protein
MPTRSQKQPVALPNSTQLQQQMELYRHLDSRRHAHQTPLALSSLLSGYSKLRACQPSNHRITNTARCTADTTSYITCTITPACRFHNWTRPAATIHHDDISASLVLGGPFHGVDRSHSQNGVWKRAQRATKRGSRRAGVGQVGIAWILQLCLVPGVPAHQGWQSSSAATATVLSIWTRQSHGN